jgi:hypothetical protein
MKMEARADKASKKIIKECQQLAGLILYLAVATRQER